MSALAYVVTGESGCYSDWSLWVVAVFADRTQAEATASRLRQRLAKFTVVTAPFGQWPAERR